MCASGVCCECVMCVCICFGGMLCLEKKANMLYMLAYALYEAMSSIIYCLLPVANSYTLSTCFEVGQFD